MKEREKTFAIAEACGGKWIEVTCKGNPARSLCMSPDSDWKVACSKELPVCQIHMIPNYLGDWNACHDMVDSLSFVERGRWIIMIDSLTRSNEWLPDRLLKAPQSKWCEAFLRVKKLWRDEVKCS